MTQNRPSPHPLALAMEWVAKITTVGLEMVVPAMAGAYLDRQWGTSYWALAGVVLGFVVGMWHLLQMTKASNRRRRPDGEESSGGPPDA